MALKALKQHQSMSLDFEEKHIPLNFEHENESNLSVMCNNVKFPTMFPGIKENTEPIKMPLRKYFIEETNFIEEEIKQWQENYIMEESLSPWRSQCMEVKQKGNDWMLCIDYS